MSRVYGAPFAMIPEWVLDAEVSDRAIRLWCVLHRYADADGRAFPGRPKLAVRLGCGVSSIDRALNELVRLHAITVEPHYRADGSRTANSYWLWPSTPPVEGTVPTGDKGVRPDLTPPPPAQHAAGGTENQGTENQEDTPAADGSDEHPGHEVVRAFYDWCETQNRPKPTLPAGRQGNQFMALVHIVENLLEAGWSVPEVKVALTVTRAFTTDAMTFSLTERRQQRGAAKPIDTDRARPSGAVGAEELWEGVTGA